MDELMESAGGRPTVGLTTDQVRELMRQGKTNAVADEAAGAGRIVVSNVFTYFNAIFALLTILLCVAGLYKNLAFLIPVIANTVVGIVQQLRSKRVLDELALLDVAEYQTLRDGHEVAVSTDALVLGDCVRLVAGQQVPADAVVVAGEGAVNESLLTGEADEVEKGVGADLKSGSFVASGNLLVRLTQVGADSYAARLEADARKAKDRKSEMVLGVERIIVVAGVLVLPIGSYMLWQKVVQAGLAFPDAVTQVVAAVIGMIPEGLYLLVTIALALSATRLAKRKVLLHDMHSVETLARVDVLCVDKTGTITTDAMCVDEVFGAAGQGEGTLADEVGQLSAYLATVADDNQTMRALVARFGGAEPLHAEQVTPFSSRLKHSEVVCGDIVWLLGAPQFVLDEAEMTRCASEIERRTRAGRRVLCLARRKAAEEASAVLFVSLKNEVRSDARETFAHFASQGVEVRVISGDDPLTASAVAREAGIAGAERAVDASTLDTPEKLERAVAQCVVFGRVKPEQKRELVSALRTRGLKVAMTGDGVNDILAMKEADCSIAMGTGSDAARQAAQVVLLDSDFSHMKEIVGEGRRDINNITRSATLFLYKNIFSLALALFSIFGSFVYPLAPNQVSLISFFNIGLPAFLLAFEPNERKQEGRFLREVVLRSLPAALTSFLSIAYLMGFARLFGISGTDVATSSTYLLSAVGFLVLIALISPVNPYRLGVFVSCLVGFALCSGFLRGLFDISGLSARALALVVVFAVAEVGTLDMLGVVFVRVRRWILSHADAGRG